MTKRATKGGEFGANGEWYEGGKFINTVAENAKKEGSKPKGAKARKVEIEPYKWVISDQRPIFSIVGTGAMWIDRNDRSKGIAPFPGAFLENGEPRMGAGSRTLAEVQVLCDRFNAGERFI